MSEEDVSKLTQEEAVNEIINDDFETDNDKIKFENNEEFSFFVIEPNHIADRDWMSPTYLFDLVNDKFCSIHNSNPEKFVESIGTLLKVNDYDYPDIKTTVVHEEPNYMYEIMYVNTTPKYHIEENKNEFALLIQNNGDDQIYGSMLLLKSHLPVENMNSATLCKVTKNDVIDMLSSRANTSVVIYDNEFSEERVLGPMDMYADIFFQSECKKVEFPFLKHNVNIWYTESDDGDYVLGDLLNIKIDKCIIFTLINDNYRGNISLGEVQKIIHLSSKLEKYDTPVEYSSEEKDELGRNIIKNKYRILHKIYNSNL